LRFKTENILIVDRDKNNYPRIKICDFGTSKMFEKGAIQRKLVGSSYYIAPEVLKKHYDEKCDLWSCGVILYILLSGRPPFGGENDKEIMERVAVGKYDIQSSPFNKVSKAGIDLIQKLLIMEPKKRISAQEALLHPWFKENKSKELFNQIKDESALRKLINNLKSYKKDSIIQETA
jgi:calcium-dependent protein kinase